MADQPTQDPIIPTTTTQSSPDAAPVAMLETLSISPSEPLLVLEPDKPADPKPAPSQDELAAQSLPAALARLHTHDILIDTDDVKDELSRNVEMRFASSRHGQLAFNRTSSRFEQYGVDPTELGLRPWDTSSRPDHSRIEKKIRIRVRYSCHLCSSPMGRNRACLSCDHHQCHQCLRSPPKRVVESTRRVRHAVAESSTALVDGATHRTGTWVDTSVGVVPVP